MSEKVKLRITPHEYLGASMVTPTDNPDLVAIPMGAFTFRRVDTFKAVCMGLSKDHIRKLHADLGAMLAHPNFK